MKLAGRLILRWGRAGGFGCWSLFDRMKRGIEAAQDTDGDMHREYSGYVARFGDLNVVSALRHAFDVKAAFFRGFFYIFFVFGLGIAVIDISSNDQSCPM